MSGISRISAMIIATTPVEAYYGDQDPTTGKWQGIIGHSKDHPNHPYMPILSSTFTYDTPEAATLAMQEQIKLITEAVNKESV